MVEGCAVLLRVEHASLRMGHSQVGSGRVHGAKVRRGAANSMVPVRHGRVLAVRGRDGHSAIRSGEGKGVARHGVKSRVRCPYCLWLRLLGRPVLEPRAGEVAHGLSPINDFVRVANGCLCRARCLECDKAKASRLACPAIPGNTTLFYLPKGFEYVEEALVRSGPLEATHKDLSVGHVPRRERDASLHDTKVVRGKLHEDGLELILIEGIEELLELKMLVLAYVIAEARINRRVAQAVESELAKCAEGGVRVAARV
mmetsp:Transcript_29000/g.78002  ORF Transcript_29000/g.78002 Transcript_29000/m.78002 type:complete len:257 (-) Transcript_29000:170-940(-)